MINLEFKKIELENFYKVCSLGLEDCDKGFIVSNETSLAEAYLFKSMGAFVLPLAIYHDNNLVGFTMITKGYVGDDVKSEYLDNYCVLRLMMDSKYQNKGLGKETLEKIVSMIKDFDSKQDFIWISAKVLNARALHVYESVGFKKTNDYCIDEIILKYDLSN